MKQYAIIENSSSPAARRICVSAPDTEVASVNALARLRVQNVKEYR